MDNKVFAKWLRDNDFTALFSLENAIFLRYFKELGSPFT